MADARPIRAGAPYRDMLQDLRAPIAELDAALHGIAAHAPANILLRRAATPD